ncbi:MAG: TonB-dependent receptor [Sphingomonas sp.]|nr:TonB-dependent receptor [Sphingomonas sp.]
MIAFCKSALLSATALGALVAMPAAAQDKSAATSATADVDGDIVVTAQRREQRLQDVPVAVSVVTGDALTRQNLTSLNDVAARLPNVKISTGTIANAITIRGVGSGPNPGFEQSVATFVDGVYRSRSRSTRAALFDIERVEVLKGPQTTFFGANAIAGALNIVTRKPGDVLNFNAAATYVPSTEEYDLQLGLDAPLSNTLSARVAGRVAGSSGYIKSDYTGDEGPRDRSVQGRIALKWEPDADFRSDLRVDAGRSRNRNAGMYQLVGCPPPASFTIAAVNTCGRYLAQNGGRVENQLDYHSSSGRTYGNYDFIEGAWTNSVKVGTGSINMISGYFWHQNQNAGQGIPFPLTDAVGGTNGYPTYQNETYRQFSQEIRYQSGVGGTLEYMVGAYAAHGELRQRSIAGFRYQAFGARDTTRTFNAASPLAGNNIITQNDTTWSGFASATVRPIERLRINLGARYSSIRKRADRQVKPGLSDNFASPDTFVPVTPAQEAIISSILGSVTANFANPERTDKKFMPSASVQFDIAPRVMVYASYTNGFKAGGYSFGANNEQFSPETVDAYEVGLKGSFFDRRLNSDLTFYRSDYNNLQETSLQLQPNGSISSLVQNVAKSRSQGIEFNNSLRAAPWLTLNANIAYLDATYTSYPNGACTIAALAQITGCRQNLTGKRRPFAPKWSGNVGARMTMDFGDNRLTVDPLVYFTTRYFMSATADPLLEQRGYTKVDLRVGFGPSDGRWELAIVGKNLTDKLTTQYKQSIPLAPGSIAALVEPPRTVGVQLTIR